MIELTNERAARYARNVLLKDFGVEGQKKLLAGSVLIVGVGGLGSPAAYYLAAAGVGRIGLVDSDRVELSNLQRQILHFTSDLGVSKVDSAREKLCSLNPDVTVEVHQERFTPEIAMRLVSGYDFVIDGTDNFESKFLINDACFFAKTPFVHAGILAYDGQALTVFPGESACVRCVFDDVPPAGAVRTTAEAGVLGAVAGAMGIVEAIEAIKFITGVGEPLTNRFMLFSALDSRSREVKLKRNPACPLCGVKPRITVLP